MKCEAKGRDIDGKEALNFQLAVLGIPKDSVQSDCLQ